MHVDVIWWLGQLGLSKVCIELDCKLVIDIIVDRWNNHSECGNIMAICRVMLQHFLNFKLSFIRRQANFIAHSLIRASKLHRHQIFDLIPSYIPTNVKNEMI